MGIVEFLEVRIAEDEVEANAAALRDSYFHGAEAAKGRKDRVLAECAAKRWIIELYKQHRENRDARRSPLAREFGDERAAQARRTQEARTRVADDALRALASVYKDHPEYNQEWAL